MPPPIVPAPPPTAPEPPASPRPPAVIDVPASPFPVTPAASRPPIDDRQPVEASVTADNPAGRQEPAVSIEWGGTPVAKVGQVGEYSVIVRNVCNIPVQQVAVRVRVPAGMALEATAPRAASDGGLLVWEIGTLSSREERRLSMKLKAEAKGDHTPVAWVTFTGNTAMKIRVREPRLAVTVAGPEKALMGDQAQFTLTVTNPGDGAADQVKVQATLSGGLEHARGSKVDFEIGSLAPNESRSVALLCATRAGGVQKCDVTASAEGGLVARGSGNLSVIMPRLDLHLAGPHLRYLDRKAIYTLKVTNPGDAAASNVTIAHVVPAGFKVLAASDGGRHDYQTRTVSWFIGDLGAGLSREVKVEVQALGVGDHQHKAAAVGARGLRAEAELSTRVEGVAALLVELVDTEDPIEAGGDTAYEVTVTNTGSKTEENIKLVATIPDKMQMKSAEGPVRYSQEGRTVVFEPIGRLAPRAHAQFKIHVRALEAGSALMKIQITSLNLTDPVVKMESTRIYSDAEPTPAVRPAPPAAPPAIPPAGPPSAPPAPPPPGLPGG
jgi:uncharacterized repeat protein (TIGR01451 family)